MKKQIALFMIMLLVIGSLPVVFGEDSPPPAEPEGTEETATDTEEPDADTDTEDAPAGPEARKIPNAIGKMNLKPTMWPGAPKNSLILSLATGCLPGILYNLNKARQIECQYLNCLYNDVSRGVPYFMCTRIRNYGWCKFVWGEIFQLIPFANFVQWLTGIVQGLLSNPISAFLGLSDLSCAIFVPVTPSTGWGFCRVINAITAIGNVIKDLIGLKNMDWSLKDSCGEILDQVDAARAERLTGTDTGTLAT